MRSNSSSEEDRFRKDVKGKAEVQHMELTIENVEKVLDEQVRPSLAGHGGDIQVMELRDGILKVRLLGQCSGCPSASLTMEELKQTVLVTGVSDDLIAQARELMKQRHS